MHLVDPPAGLVGNVVTLNDDDAGDDDYGSATADTEIAFAFQPPKAGLIEVLIDAQSTVSASRVFAKDEFGWSDSFTRHQNFLSLRVLHPNVPEPSLAQMANFSISLDINIGVVHESLNRGQHYFSQLFSAGPVPAGGTVIVLAGTRSHDYSHANDVKINSRSDFQWFINSVEVRIAP